MRNDANSSMCRTIVPAIVLFGALLLLADSSSNARNFQLHADGSGDYPTIQAALLAATNGDSITLADGTYLGDGNRDIDFLGKAVTILSRSDIPSLCVIDCQGGADTPHRAFWFHSGEDSTSIVRGLTLRNGWAADNGGAILCEQFIEARYVGPTIINCILLNNVAAINGGAICLHSSCAGGSRAIIRRTHFISNYASCGGGIFLTCGDCPQLSDCTFVENRSTDGGAVGYYSFCYDTSFMRCLFRSNFATSRGGAVYGMVETYVHYRDCEFIANVAGNDGGAIYVPNDGKSAKSVMNAKSFDWFSNCRFVDNAAVRGGAAFIWGCGWGIFNECIFRHNTADEGGAIYSSPGTMPQIDDCLFIENTARRGGGLFMGGYDVPYFLAGRIRGCTLVSNEAPEGAGILIDGSCPTLTMERLIVAFNRNGAGIVAGIDGAPALVCCDLYGNEGGDWVGAIAGQVDGSGNFSANPCFCDAPNGVFTLAGDSWCLAGRHPWGCDELVGALDVGCPPMGCSGPVPVLVAAFRAITEGDGIAISGRLEGDFAPASIRLLGVARGNEWPVLLKWAGEGQFSAVDIRGMEALHAAQDGRITYHLQLASEGEWSTLRSEEIDSAQLPRAPSLTLRVTPNPFNPRTTLRFDLPVGGRVHLEVYDVAGRLVRTLLDADLPAGSHQAVWDGKDERGMGVASGSYFARLEAGGKLQTVRMSLIQ